MILARLALARLALSVPLILCLFSVASAQELKIYFIDVDGGQATLFVSGKGEAMVVDAGWPGNENRDAKKIAAAAKDAGVTEIGKMLTTHYHTDHVGGVAQLAGLMPIRTFLDHGENLEQSANAAKLYDGYLAVRAKGAHKQLNPGDSFAFGSAMVRVVSARKELIAKPLKARGAGSASAACAGAPPMKGDGSENEMSIGFVVEFGRFRMLDLGDLLWNEEASLVCPVNKIGDIDLYLTTHHGFKSSGNPVLVNAIRPRVAIMNNGTKKGGDPGHWNTVKAVPGLEDRWQLQKSVLGDGTHNVADEKIASLAPQLEPSWIKVVARKNGSFTVSNSRNGLSTTYGPRR
ncbi:MAG: MBL fold metallo-hydrolase [Bryobacterales bacterium]|nr:MBL fold metallo-hydrolase [Bryobacterales bacterium]